MIIIINGVETIAHFNVLIPEPNYFYPHTQYHPLFELMHILLL